MDHSIHGRRKRGKPKMRDMPKESSHMIPGMPMMKMESPKSRSKRGKHRGRR